jgi:hypothetical protein
MPDCTARPSTGSLDSGEVRSIWALSSSSPRTTADPSTFSAEPGLLSALAGTGLLIWMFIRHLMGLAVGNHPALITGVLFEVVAVQLLSFGLLGELLVYLFPTRSRDRPLPPDDIIRKEGVP